MLASVQAPPDPGSAAPTLSLYASDTGVFANGADAAIIQAFLTAVVDRTTTITFHNSGGSREVLTIPAGADYGELAVRSRRAGTVTVSYIDSEPEVRLDATVHDAKPKFKFTFLPVIEKVVVKARPTQVSLFDSVNLTVHLFDANSQPVETERLQLVEFDFGTSGGRVEPAEPRVLPHESMSSARFFPTSIGTITISASTGNVLPGNVVSLQVSRPWGILALTMLCASFAALLQFATRGPRALASAAVAGSAGVLIGWALIFALVTLVPPRLLLNPISPLVAASLTAWAAALLADRFGWSGVKDAAPLQPQFSSRLPQSAAVTAEPAVLVRRGAALGGTSSDAPDRPLAIFFSYAHEDEPLKQKLVNHLRLLERNGLIQMWHDRELKAGDTWRGEIEHRLLRGGHHFAADQRKLPGVRLRQQRRGADRASPSRHAQGSHCPNHPARISVAAASLRSVPGAAHRRSTDHELRQSRRGLPRGGRTDPSAGGVAPPAASCREPGAGGQWEHE